MCVRSRVAVVAVSHPSPEIPQELVDRVYRRRGRLYAYESLEPSRTALVVVDVDAGSAARELEPVRDAVQHINQLGAALRSAGGTVAFVVSAIGDPASLEQRLGRAAAEMYVTETQPGGIGTVLYDGLIVDDDDLHAVKSGASAFFPGTCDLHRALQARGITSILITGLMTNICCESSGRDAHELGYQVTMISDANVGQSYGLHEASLATFFRYFGDVRTTSDALGLISR